MTETDLGGFSVLAIVSDYGIEQDELVVPVEHLKERGARVVIASTSDGPVQTLVGDKEPGRTVQPDTVLEHAKDDDGYDLLLIPGGTINADNLRQAPDAVRVATRFIGAGKPIAAICHGPWTLVEANAVRGKTLTSWPSIKTDIKNAGGKWVDQEVCVDGMLVTSRKPDDIPAFNAKMIEVFAIGDHVHEEARR
jgi:protease I